MRIGAKFIALSFVVAICAISVGFTVSYVTPVVIESGADILASLVSTAKSGESPDPAPSPSPSPSPVASVIGQDRVVSLFLKGSLGHACPISPSEALTAEHVALESDQRGGFNAPMIVWGDTLGNSGTVQWVWSDVRRDLSLIRIAPETAPFPAYLRVSKSVPKNGDLVYIIGYKWDLGLLDYTVEAKVINSTAGTLIYDATPGPGSSGSCVLNQQGEIVAINVASVHGNGLGLLVTGDWTDVPEQFKVRASQ